MSQNKTNEEIVLEQVQKDVEAARDPEEFLPGYVEFSRFIASDYSLSTYRKFGALGARNLLYLQAELQYMEHEIESLDEFEKENLARAGNMNEKIKDDSAARSWEDMQRLAREGDATQVAKIGMIQDLRKLMKAYGGSIIPKLMFLTCSEKALLRRSQVLQLEKPEDGPFKAFTAWFRVKQPLWGSGYRLLDNEEDMISLGSQDEPDRISSLMHRCLGYRLRNYRKTPKSWGLVYYYSPGTVSLIVAILSILASASLLVGAIATLYFVKTMNRRLGIVGAFVVLFAGSLTLFTNARRVEIYGATAAYAAVLVVFISVNT